MSLIEADHQFRFLTAALSTARLQVRAYRQGDGAEVYRLLHLNQSRLQESFPATVTGAANAAAAASTVEGFREDWSKGRRFAFGIWDAAGHQYLGHIVLKNIDWSVPRAELAYFLDTSVEGQGLMAEALLAVIDWAINQTGFRKLFARVLPANDRSSRVLERCGFVLEGIIRSDFKTGSGALSDVRYYGLTLADFKLARVYSRG